jgi:biopolymer transport protein ExbD
VFLDKKPVGNHELAGALGALVKDRPGVRVFISGDQDARNGAIMAVLDAVRAAGIEKVGFEIRNSEKAGTP